METLDIVVAVAGLAICLFAVVAFRNPRLALRGRRGRMWARMIGEEKTIWLGRYLGVPILVLVGAFCLAIGVTGKASEMQARRASIRGR